VEDEDLSPGQKKLRAMQAKDPCIWCSPKEAARVIGCGLTTIRKMIESGELPSRLDFGRRLILKSAAYDRGVAGLGASIPGNGPIPKRSKFPGKRPHELKAEREAAKKPEPVK
jgi:excisionase family DNA binding protein